MNSVVNGKQCENFNDLTRIQIKLIEDRSFYSTALNVIQLAFLLFNAYMLLNKYRLQRQYTSLL